MKRSYRLLQEAIKLTPRNPNDSRDCQATVEILAELIGGKDGASKAQAIFDHFRRDGTTPAAGIIKLPGIEPYPYEPHQIIVGNDGTYKELAEATVEYMQAEVERAERRFELARWDVRAANAALN